MPIPVFQHATYLPGCDQFHFARLKVPTDRPRRLHRQDYHELFWIQNGSARHLLLGGEQRLSEGDLVFVRPDDAHGLQGLGPETWLVNILPHPKIVADIARRHPEAAARSFHHHGNAPVIFPRTIRQLADLSQAAIRLEAGARSALRIEAFLTGLLSDLTDAGPDLPAGAPGWLAEALRAAEEKEVFREGAAGLVRVAGRQHAHVSRVCREVLGQTPTEIVNAIRMDHAARRLTGSPDSMAEIAFDCGFETLSHFHKLFKARHGMTPRAWRARYQKNVIRPV